MMKASGFFWFFLSVLALTHNSIASENASSTSRIGEDISHPSTEIEHHHVTNADEMHFHEEQELPPDLSKVPIENLSDHETSSRFLARFSRPVAPACVDSDFASSGPALILAITTQGVDCVGRLFSKASDQVLAVSFTEANIITVAGEARNRSEAYDGTDPDDSLSALYYWLRAAFYYDATELRTADTQAATNAAVRALASNSHFFDQTSENAYVVYHAAVNLRNASIGEHFVDVTRAMLSRYDESYEAVPNWGRAMVNLSWTPLQACANNSTCRNAHHSAELVRLIGDFMHNNIDWLDTAASDYHLYNLSFQLAKFYQGSNDINFTELEPELDLQLNRIFTEFGPYRDDIGRRSYLTALQSLSTYGSCERFGVCSKRQEILDTVLDNRMNCASGTLFLWAQDMNVEEMQWTCRSLGPQEDYFHEAQQTNRIPVIPDDNDRLRMIIFDDSREWRTYGGLLFGVGTNNGGLYIEGNPAVAGDQATFYAYENVNVRPVFDVWNLRHEYVHYLDGRFIEKGGFSDFLGAGRTVWYLEGIGEYMSRRDCNSGAISEAALGTYSLSTIFQNTYNSGSNRIYAWGYLATRFMYERHNDVYFQMLELFKQGRFEEYRSTMVDLWVANRSYDDEFAEWLTSVESVGCSVDTSRPITQQGDSIGVNACLNNEDSASGVVIEIGEAVCLAEVVNGGSVNKAVYIREELSGYQLELSLRHGAGNTRMSFRHGTYPTESTFDQVETGAGTEKTLIVNSVESGWNYLIVEGVQDFSAVTLLAQLKSNYVPVELAPVARINGPYAQTTGQAVAFSSTGSVDSDGTILGYNWEFGDGNSSVDPNPTHLYDQAGRYIATLRVIDDDGLENTVSTIVDITDPVVATGACANQDPMDSLILNLNESYCLPARADAKQIQMAMYVNSGAVGKALEFQLSHGTGNANLLYRYGSRPTRTRYDQIADGPGNVESIIVDSAQAGWNYIHVRADTEFSGVTLTTRVIETGGPVLVPPNAVIDGSYTAMLGDTVTFSSTGSNDGDGTIVAYSWDFGDGHSSTEPNPTHQYEQIGSYNVTLRVTDNDGLENSDTTVAVITNTDQLTDVCASQSPTDPLQQLQLGETYCLPDKSAGRQLQMALYVHNDLAGKSLEIQLNHGTGNANLLYRYGSRPTRDNYDQISNGPGNVEVIVVDSVQVGWNYIHVRADLAYSAVSLRSRILN